MNAELLLQETICLLSADLYQKLYSPENGRGYQETARTIIDYANEFEKRLNWQGDSDTRDYIFELEKFEEEILEKL